MKNMVKGMNTYHGQEKARIQWALAMEKRENLITEIKAKGIPFPSKAHQMKLKDLEKLNQLH